MNIARRVAAILSCSAAVSASADPILFRHEGTNATGTLDGVPFSTSHFMFEGVSDTSNRESLGSVFSTVHTSATANVEGLGLLNILTPTRTFVNNDVEIVGMSRASGTDLFNGPTDSAFGTWDMLSPIGPIVGSGALLQWYLGPIVTDRGVLFFSNAATPATFTAIPEPASLALFVLVAMGCRTFRANACN